ncbi:unknown protein [Seminavis robusta]|uniref:Uncharacterized protein n=1 Tax=Seminavis robusta TaxID=568900 RepID=A0A9N8DIY6_9STRA|nr:unknown protein [Seminavis robusta]|eukprot:Sro154_g069850.1 n/a (529) ;mRNA; f:3234-5277
MNGKKYIYCPYHHTTKWVLEVNNKGVVHKTGCEKMKEALAAAKATDKPSGATEPDPAAVALANAIEDVGTDTLLPVPLLLAVALANALATAVTWKKGLKTLAARAERAFDDAAEEAHLTQMLLLLAAENMPGVLEWFRALYSQPMSFLLFAMLYEEPTQLLLRSVAYATCCVVDTATFAMASTEFGAALCTFLAVARTLFLWGSSPQEPPAYVPKRLRRGPSLLSRVCKSSIGKIKSVSCGVLSTVLLIIQLSHLSVMESSDVPSVDKRHPCTDEPFLDQDDDTEEPAKQQEYDADSVLIAIDNCSSRCITNCMKDFIGKPTKVNVTVQGIGGTVTATYKGTVRWSIKDDDGRVHHFVIPDTYYNPSTPYRLLSPQHWAKVAEDNLPQQRGTWCATYEDSVELFWGQRSFRRVIPLSSSNNIAIVRSAPSYSKLHSFCSEIASTVHADIQGSEVDELELLCCPAASISDDESSISSTSSYDDEADWEVRAHPDLPSHVGTEDSRSKEFQQKDQEAGSPWCIASISHQG